MNTASYERVRSCFLRIGAEVRIVSEGMFSFSLDIERKNSTEFFRIAASDRFQIDVADIQPRDRHLLLMVKEFGGRSEGSNSKFLCGHDERHYFVAAIPETSGASTVRSAKQALKPDAILQVESVYGVRSKDLHSRRRRLKSGVKIYRQGEFMFVPQPDFVPRQSLAILKHEKMMRTRTASIWGSGSTRGNPHIAYEAYRERGTRVYVNGVYPNGLTELERLQLFVADRAARSLPWTVQVSEPTVHVRGTVRHPEHATIDLGRIWHRVYLNTESQAKAMRNVAFLD